MIAKLLKQWRLRANDRNLERESSRRSKYRIKLPLSLETMEDRLTPAVTGVTGSSAPFDNLQPYATTTYAIALEGIFPPRNLSADTHALTTGSFDSYVGEIVQLATNFAPVGYALCEGQILAISTNTALFSILGTTYGGNGTTTFALPDLRGRTPIGTGTGPGLGYTVDLGETLGDETVSLTANELPSHTHSLTSGQTDPAGGGQSFSTMQPSLGLTAR
jgi:microcystin-dependent protein